MDAGRLLEEHHGALLRYLVRLTGDGDLAADAVQEAFTRLAEKPPREERLRARLFAVATDAVLAAANGARRRRAPVERSAARVPAGPAPSRPDAALERSETGRMVRAALDSLPEKDRTALLMREEGFTHREIAEVVGTTAGSVGPVIARALDKLAGRLPLDPEDTP